MAHHLRALTALLLTSTPAMAAEPWEGIWKALEASCDWQDAPVAYTQKNVNGWESTCEVTKVQRLSVESSWLLDLDCWGEGEGWKTKELVMLDSKGHLNVFGNRNLSILERCERKENSQ